MLDTHKNLLQKMSDMFNNLNVALIQDDIVWENKEANIIKQEMNLASLSADTDIAILPEMFTTGFTMNGKHLAETNTGHTIDMVKQWAHRFGFAIAGSFLAKTGDMYYNRAFIIEPNGDESYYDKRHLFRMAGEHEAYSHGNNRMIVRYRGWNISIVVCYDLRFPVWCRAQNNDYDLLIVVANWPQQRDYPWQQLLIARAIENESYVCGVNRTGIDAAGNQYIGSSLALDFKGVSIGTAPINNIITATLTKDNLNSFRSKFPAWKDADNFSIKI